jgi:GNAT superfamily N-acetyltransferase
MPLEIAHGTCYAMKYTMTHSTRRVRTRKMDISIATEEDIPALGLLLEQLFSQEVEFHPDTAAQQRGLRLIIDHPDTGFILIGRKNGIPVGMVNILFTISTALGERVALLEDMVVDKNHRREGYGSMLLASAVSEAGKRGCRRITLLTDLANKAGHRFYERHGFSRSTMVPFRFAVTDCAI